jgi:ATP-binding cassette subfamily B protein
VTRALHSVLAGTTALVVAHRPSTVVLADQVALLEDGVITAQGTHAHMLASQPRYRELMSGSAGQPNDARSSDARSPDAQAPEAQAPDAQAPEAQAPEAQAAS